MSAHLDGSHVAPVIGALYWPACWALDDVPDGVAVDPAAHLVYRANNDTDAIAVTDYGGTAVAMLYHNGNPYSNPEGIALH
jgi:DNA-binding beta-propeller fold protein YncE